MIFSRPLLAGEQDPVESNNDKQFAQWIDQFKRSPKGPFEKIRWFCADGTILPPGENACAGHGKGIQHATLNDRALRLREAGFFIGNVLAALDTDKIANTPDDRLQQLLLERFLAATDDGWIYRGARYYRGAMQVEDEVAAARRLLVAMGQARQDQPRDFLLLRTAAKLLPHGTETPGVVKVRNLSSQLGEQDTGFEKLRNKIHSQPDASDAMRVRSYAQQLSQAQQQDYLQLAMAIDAVFADDSLDSRLQAVVKSLASHKAAGEIRKAYKIFTQDIPADARLKTAASLLRLLREQLPILSGAAQWLDVLDASLVLEQQAFTAAAEIRGQLAGMTRRDRLQGLRQLATVLYGTGELTLRQWQSVEAALDGLDKKEVSLADYREQLQYLARVSHWVERWYQFHFSLAVEQLSKIEEKTRRFIPDQLRAGPVLHFSAILDSLVIDANLLAGVGHRVFSTTVGGGVRTLNPGIARGKLEFAATAGQGRLQQDVIYILPETTAELEPVAGIMSLGEGNALSHVQILARNLGIPNIAIDESLLPLLKPFAGKSIVMAVSPGGRVVIDEGGPAWQDVFGEQAALPDDRLVVDLGKLDLSMQQFVSLDHIRAIDAGRIAGPKAANLGELRHHFPKQVPQGIVIPFGAFYAQLQQPMPGSGQSLFEWMQAQYQQLGSLQGTAYEQRRDNILATLQARILDSDPGEDFREQLKTVLQYEFGDEQAYTLFVRSDTNMEDLPGFTGAGLNLTVANVKGFEELLHAIKRVWASPFGPRAFAWRQQRMLQPEHVYVSILLMPSINVEKSGVMVTADITNNKPGWASIAVNEGQGGAVQGEAAEELRVNVASGEVQLLAEATAPLRRQFAATGGVRLVPVSGSQRVLSPVEIEQLREIARLLPLRYPMYDEQGGLTPTDVEFGFQQGQLVLLQARPYLASRQAMGNQYLRELDQGLQATLDRRVELDKVPAG